MIVYDKFTGLIINRLSKDQEVEIFYKDYPDDFNNKLGTLTLDSPLDNIKNYKVENGKLIKISSEETLEIMKYNRTLTEDERQLQKLKPSHEEVRKAEQTIEILTLIQEVI